MPFRTWFVQFESYLDLVETERGAVLDNKMKNQLLFSLLRTEGVRQFGRTEAIDRIKTDTLDIFLAAVKEYFQHPVSKCKCHFDMQMRHQAPSESATEFLAALREPSPDFHLGTYEMLIELYVAASPCQPIIGRDLIRGHNLIINAPSGSCIYSVNSVESPSVQVVASKKQPNYSNLLNCFPALLLP